jgi:monofunctional biosynthetic peptidoglycan transglycosylase
MQAKQGAMARKSKPAKVRKAGTGFWGWIRRLIGWAIVIGVVIPVVLVAIYRFAPPPADILMVERAIQGKGWDYRWRPLRKISPALVQAAVASEDARFCDHHGFDFDAIQKAMAHNEKHPNRIRGASTISQQTAKNVFLWPGRDWVRKGMETYFTVLIETIWGKARIMEVYLNVAEMGPGVYGAEAAARKYFKTDAAHLTAAQAARLVAVLPNPTKYRAAAPGRYVRGRAAHIGAAAGTVRRDGLADCVL